MGTKSPIENKFLNYRAFQRKRVRKAKLACPSAESTSLTVRGGNRQKYVTAKKQRKTKQRNHMVTRHIKIAKEKERRMKQITQAQAEGRLEGVSIGAPKVAGPKQSKMGE